MNERERKQLETKLRNRRAEFDASLSQFRSSGLGSEMSPEDYLNGEPSRLELEFLAAALPAYAKPIFTSAKEVSRSRSVFETTSKHVMTVKSHFSAEIDYLYAQISGLRTTPRVMQLNFQATENAKQALIQIDRIAAEAEFDFSMGNEIPQPSEKDLVAWIKQCGWNNSKEAWRRVKEQDKMPRPSKAFFDACWKTVHGPRGRGRPPAKAGNQKIIEIN